MQPDFIGGLLDFTMGFSGFAALFFILLNAAIYGAMEGKGGPYVKQMIACLAAITVFIFSCTAKLLRWALSG